MYLWSLRCWCNIGEQEVNDRMKFSAVNSSQKHRENMVRVDSPSMRAHPTTVRSRFSFKLKDGQNLQEMSLVTNSDM